jgi:hypothetical protein
MKGLGERPKSKAFQLEELKAELLEETEAEAKLQVKF